MIAIHLADNNLAVLKTLYPERTKTFFNAVKDDNETLQL